MKQIIVLPETDFDTGKAVVVLWAAVPKNYEKFYANPQFESEHVGATQQELDALRAGQYVERVQYMQAADMGVLTADAPDAWRQWQNEITKKVKSLNAIGVYYENGVWVQ